jgi:hypothetical protein
VTNWVSDSDKRYLVTWIDVWADRKPIEYKTPTSNILWIRLVRKTANDNGIYTAEVIGNTPEEAIEVVASYCNLGFCLSCVETKKEQPTTPRVA